MLSALLLLIVLLTAMSALIPKKVAVVTGGNKGIGFEICRKLGHAGVKTILACRNEELGRNAAEDLSGNGIDIEYRNLDINNDESIKKFAESLMKDYPHIDILVNNAAMAYKGSDPTPFKQQARPTMKVNYFGTVSTVMHLLPLLRASPNGPRIVNVASFAGHLQILKSEELKQSFTSESLTLERLNSLVSSFVDDVESGIHSSKGWPNTCYGFSKLAVIAFTKVMTRTNPEILSLVCCPGSVKTDMSSQRGHKTPAEGAMTPALLSMADASSLTPGGFYQNEREIIW